MLAACPLSKSDLLPTRAEPLGLFLQDYADSVQWVHSNPAQAAQLLAKHDFDLPSDIAAEAIPRKMLDPDFFYLD